MDVTDVADASDGDTSYSVLMELTTLSREQQILFSSIVAILIVFSLIANFATLIVGIRSRKIRPFFRTCLICLATSDLLSTIFSGITYISQYSGPYVQTWRLGALMCNICPFVTTLAILANSITLVGIALDRYLSIIKLIRALWEPKGVYCVLFAIVIWGLSIGIATPTIMAYKHISIDIVLSYSDDPVDPIDTFPAYLCAASKKDNARYYMILLCILFIPIVLAFIWFNSVLAYELWNRRQAMQAMNRSSYLNPSNNSKANYQLPENSKNNQKSTETQTSSSVTKKSSKTKTVRTTSTAIAKSSKIYSRAQMSRDSRQLKLFFIILILMIMFLLFRMPAWIFLMLKFYISFMSTEHWLLQYWLSVMSLIGCLLNPLLYAFLTQTIQYAVTIYKKARYCFCRSCCDLVGKLFIRQSPPQPTTETNVATENSIINEDRSRNEIYVIANHK